MQRSVPHVPVTPPSAMEDDAAFESFSCPITGSLMEDPVMTVGTSELKSWFYPESSRTHKYFSPPISPIRTFSIRAPR